MSTANTRRGLTAAIAVLALTAGIPSQSSTAIRTAERPLQQQVVPIHTAAPWKAQSYGIWAAGSTYKVSFHDGMTFVPYLGASYPHNQPFQWRTESVTIGGTQLLNQQPVLQHTDYRAAFDHGRVVEAYDVLANGLEQTFVLASAPTDGDLVVRGVVNTMLHADAMHEEHRDLHFRDAAGSHLLTYGRATAVDANGERCAMTTSFADGTITLRLDGRWLSSATFPIVVDPLIGPGSQLVSNSISSLDIISDSTGSALSDWVSYSYAASLFDRDLRCVRFNADMSTNNAVFADLSSTWSSSSAKAAIVPVANAGLVVFERRSSTLQTTELRLHIHDRNDLTLQSSSTAIPTTGFPSRPVIGGNDNTYSGDKVMIAWQYDGSYSGGNSSIKAIVYDVGSATFGLETTIAASIGVDYERPSINRNQRFTPGSWLIAYQSLSMLAIGPNINDWGISVVRVDEAGNSTAPMQIDSANGDHQFAPQIEGIFGHYLVTYVTEPVVPGNPPYDSVGDVAMLARVDWPDGAASGTQPYGARTFYQGTQANSVVLGGVAIDGATIDHWAITVSDTNSGGFFANRVGFRGDYLSQDTVLTSGISVAGAVSYDYARQEFTLTYAQNSGLFNGYALVNRLARPNAPPLVVSGSSCSAATINWIGTQLIGDQNSKVRVDGAPNNAIQTMALSLAPVSLPITLPGVFGSGCNLLISSTAPYFFGLLSVTIGDSANWTIPLPEFLPNNTELYFQGFHTDGTNFEFSSTQRLQVTVVK